MRTTLVLISYFMFLVETDAQNIIYTQQIDNNDNLILMDENGDTKEITNHARKDSSPIISPDGKMVVFTSERIGWWKIWTMYLDTQEFHQLTKKSSADYSPSWSPDGKKIVFTSSRDGNQEIYVMDKNGDNKVNITKSAAEDTMPFWAKDGFIYYSSAINGTYQIARIRPDGGSKEILTSSSSNKLMPQLSNDRSKILYYGDRDGNMEVYVMHIKTKEVSRLTNHQLMDIRPRWSPDNTKIVFERGNKGNNHHIYLMDADGKNVKQLTFKYYNYSPSFVPSK